MLAVLVAYQHSPIGLSINSVRLLQMEGECYVLLNQVLTPGMLNAGMVPESRRMQSSL